MHGRPHRPSASTWRKISAPAWPDGVLCVYQIDERATSWLVFQPLYGSGFLPRARLHDFPANWRELGDDEIVALSRRAMATDAGISVARAAVDRGTPRPADADEVAWLREQLSARAKLIEALMQENRVLNEELETTRAELADLNREIQTLTSSSFRTSE